MADMWAADLSPLRLRRRSAALRADPKSQEMRHFLSSHSHEARLRDAAGWAERTQRITNTKRIKPSEFRINERKKAIALADNCAARLEWRDEMDRGVRRLLLDADLAMQDDLKDIDKARLRCNQLDKTYAWYEKHGKKETKKEKPAPAYLFFDEKNPVMPGSLRQSNSLPEGYGIHAHCSSRLVSGKTAMSSLLLAAASHAVAGTEKAHTPTGVELPTPKDIKAFDASLRGGQSLGGTWNL